MENIPLGSMSHTGIPCAVPYTLGSYAYRSLLVTAPRFSSHGLASSGLLPVQFQFSLCLPLYFSDQLTKSSPQAIPRPNLSRHHSSSTNTFHLTHIS